jgi:HK97 family phage prohead protease
MKGKSRVTQEFKYAVSDDGTFEGLLATYNNVDLGGDTIEPGAFTKSLQENGNVIPLLWQHDSRQPIGSLTVADTAAGLAGQR